MRQLLTISLLAFTGACASDSTDSSVQDAGPADSTAQVDVATPDVDTADTSAPSDGSSDTSADASTDADEAGDASADASAPPPSLFLSDQFLNIAHRGGGRQGPEETMPAYELALQNGADVIECDAHTSSDGVVVCMHDDSVDRTTDGTGAIHFMTWAKLQELNAGYTFTRDGGETYPFRDQGVRIATLDAVLASFPDAWVSIEIKQSQPPMLTEFLDVIDRLDATDRIVVVSFDDATIQALRLERPDILTALALGEMFELQGAIGNPDYVPPALIMQAPKAQVTAELLEFAHSLGMKVHAWTVNNRDEMESLIAAGVDGIFTDDPVLLHDVLRR
jgi:glycerophosphoryl diester phosphodiesterase